MMSQMQGSNNISYLDYCFGCGVCASACPKKAISMNLKEDGFYKPLIDTSICIDCGVCLDICAFNHKEISYNQIEPMCSAAWSNDKAVRFNCTSGGTAFEIERVALSLGYKVCGVRYDIDQKKAYHFIAEDEEKLKATTGSKYIQSATYPAFSQFKKDGKYLVIGTPCQIDSLRRWIRKRNWEDNFILMDFFCHSVPSMLLWHKYLNHVGIQHPETVQFRNKLYGWQDSTTIRIVGDGREWFSPLSKGDLFYKFFLGDRCPNRCCVEDCIYKQKNSAADLRIGDLWGNKYIKNRDGVNALIAFTPKGVGIIDKLHAYCTLEPCDFSTVAELQMKKNCKPARSWKYVMKALKTDKSLSSISKIATIIELPDFIPAILYYYWTRLPYKLHIKQ